MKRTLKTLEARLTQTQLKKKSLETDIRGIKRLIRDLENLIDEEETEIVTSAQRKEVENGND